jgi:hypothetical protein
VTPLRKSTGVHISPHIRRASESLRRWPLAYPIMFGVLRKSYFWLTETSIIICSSLRCKAKVRFAEMNLSNPQILSVNP